MDLSKYIMAKIKKKYRDEHYPIKKISRIFDLPEAQIKEVVKNI